MNISEEPFCNSKSFNCTNGNPKCIPELWLCDGEPECSDGSDESQEICGELTQMNFFCHFDQLCS